ncbi:tetratricopeptide repeat protein [Candidatus Riflebacteria bacterium]
MLTKVISFLKYRIRRQQKLAKKQGDPSQSQAESINLYRALIFEEPDEVSNYFHLSQIYLQEKKFEQALSVLKRAFKICGQSIALFTRIIEVYEEIQDGKRLKGALKKFCREYPEEYLPFLKLADLYFKDGKYATSKKLLFKIIKRGLKNNQDVYFLLAQNFLQLRQYSRAIYNFKRARKAGIQDPIFEFNIGICLKELKRYDEALAYFRRGLKIPGVNPIFFHFQIGTVYFEKLKFERAIKAFKKVLNYSPNEEATLQFIGVCYNRLQKHQQALRYFLRLREINPEYSRIHSNLGNTYYFLKDNKNAIASFLISLDIEPDYEVIHNNIGNLYCEIGEFDTGIQYLKRAHELNPKYLMPISNLANAYKAKKDYLTSEYYFQLLINKGEISVYSYFNLAYVQYMQQEWEKATENLEKVLEIKNDHYDSLQLLGAIYFSIEQYEKSEKLYFRTLGFYPESTDIQYNIAMVSIKQKKYLEAINYLKTVLLKFPTDPTIHRFMGFCYYHLNQAEKSEFYFLKCLQFMNKVPPEPFLLELLCDLSIRLNKPSNAMKFLKNWRSAKSMSWRQLTYFCRINWVKIKNLFIKSE